MNKPSTFTFKFTERANGKRVMRTAIVTGTSLPNAVHKVFGKRIFLSTMYTKVWGKYSRKFLSVVQDVVR